MHLPRYPLAADETMTTFRFVSEGPRGKIPKLVQYTPTNLKGVHNLAFGDENEKTGEIDDLTVSNNEDSEQVLATVVAAIYAFTDLKHGSMQLEVQLQEPDFIEWELQNTYKKVKKILTFLVKQRVNGKLSKKEKSILDF